jgi:hypothetical protein
MKMKMMTVWRTPTRPNPYMVLNRNTTYTALVWLFFLLSLVRFFFTFDVVLTSLFINQIARCLDLYIKKLIVHHMLDI